MRKLRRSSMAAILLGGLAFVCSGCQQENTEERVVDIETPIVDVTVDRDEANGSVEVDVDSQE